MDGAGECPCARVALNLLWDLSRAGPCGLSRSPLSFEPMKIASTAVGDELHLLCLSDSGTIFHSIRHEGNHREKWTALHPGGDFRDVSCAGVGSTLHVIGITDQGLCVHRTRDKDGKWTEFEKQPDQPQFEH